MKTVQVFVRIPAKRHEIGVQLLLGPSLLARLPGFGLEPTRQPLSKGIILLDCYGVANFEHLIG